MRPKITDFCFFSRLIKNFLTNFGQESAFLTNLTNSGKIIGGVPPPPLPPFGAALLVFYFSLLDNYLPHLKFEKCFEI